MYAAFIFLSLLPSERAIGQSADAIRAQFNQGTVRLVTGGLEYVSNTYMRMAGEIAAVIDEEGQVRVLPFMGYGGVQNIKDLLYLRGVDICMVHSDVLTHLTQRKLLPGALWKLRHLVTLYDEVFHIVARKEISSVEQLAGRPVLIGAPGSGSEMSGQTLFTLLGIKAQFVNGTWEEGIKKVRAGEAAAIVYPTPKVSKFLKELDGDELHFLVLPINEKIRKTYERANIDHQDYPNLVPSGTSVASLQFGAIMAAYNWEPKAQRYQNVANFVNRFFGALDELKKPPRHPRWRKLDVNAVPPGWTRFPAAQQWVVSNKSKQKKFVAIPTAQKVSPSLGTEFRAFVAHMRTAGGLRNASESDLLKLFNQFRDWKKQQAPSGR